MLAEICGDILRQAYIEACASDPNLMVSLITIFFPMSIAGKCFSRKVIGILSAILDIRGFF